MPRRKERPKYTADELQALKARLLKHRGYLASALGDDVAKFAAAPTFDGSCDIRDKAQCLVSTCHALENIDMTIKLAELKAEPQWVAFDLADCGLNDE